MGARGGFGAWHPKWPSLSCLDVCAWGRFGWACRKEKENKKKKKGNEQTIKNFTVGGPLALYQNLTVVRGLLLGKWGGGGGLREGPSE